MIPEKRIIHLQKLADRLQITFTDYDMLSLALTHPSFMLEGDESHLKNNQRLEFLGDAVVDLIAGQYLFDMFPDKPEGELTKMRAALVCENSLANAARRINLGEYLLIGKGERATGGENRASNLADAWESLMGAIYLQNGIDSVRPILIYYLQPELEQVRKGHFGDYKTQLQEVVQQQKDATIHYAIIRDEGPAHNKVFTAEVYINGEAKAIGVGKTKKEAEQNAACEVLIQFGLIEK